MIPTGRLEVFGHPLQWRYNHEARKNRYMLPNDNHEDQTMVGQAFWVYCIQGLFKSGMWYGIFQLKYRYTSNFGYTVYNAALINLGYIGRNLWCFKVFWQISFGYTGIPLSPPPPPLANPVKRIENVKCEYFNNFWSLIITFYTLSAKCLYITSTVINFGLAKWMKVWLLDRWSRLYQKYNM